MSTRPNQSYRYHLLDPLRGLSALWVFMFHFPFSASAQDSLPWLINFFKMGSLGVPVFFVISGYCITGAARSLQNKGRSHWDFMKRRLRRIYPPFWLSILIVVSIPFVMTFLSYAKSGNFVLPSTSEYGFLSYSATDWIGLFTLLRVFEPGFESLQSKFTSINAVYWTLAIEEQFYIVVALALLTRRLYPSLIIVSVLSAVCAIFPETYAWGIFLPWWPAFSFGVLLYWLRERGHTPRRIFGKWTTLVVGGTAIFWIVAFLNGVIPEAAVPFAAIVAAQLWVVSDFDNAYERNASRRHFRLFAILGAMSYTLYLLHGKLQHLSLMVSRQFAPDNSIFRDVLAIALTIVACYLLFVLIEAPFLVARQVNNSPALEPKTA